MNILDTISETVKLGHEWKNLAVHPIITREHVIGDVRRSPTYQRIQKKKTPYIIQGANTNRKHRNHTNKAI